jgi:hypothetical protein
LEPISYCSPNFYKTRNSLFVLTKCDTLRIKPLIISLYCRNLFQNIKVLYCPSCFITPSKRRIKMVKWLPSTRSLLRTGTWTDIYKDEGSRLESFSTFFFHCLPRLFLCQPLINSFQSLQGSDSWVSVHNLQSQGGGILDPDDRLSDVVDDREQILASFEDGDGAHHHGGGDGASGSSVGTGSPDIFHVSYR